MRFSVKSPPFFTVCCCCWVFCIYVCWCLAVCMSVYRVHDWCLCRGRSQIWDWSYRGLWGMSCWERNLGPLFFSRSNYYLFHCLYGKDSQPVNNLLMVSIWCHYWEQMETFESWALLRGKAVTGRTLHSALCFLAALDWAASSTTGSATMMFFLSTTSPW